MSILNKLSDVLKEVFWMKPSSKKKAPSRRSKAVVKKSVKKAVKKTAKKSKPAVSKKAPVKVSVPDKKPVHTVKPPKAVKTPKVPAVPKVKKNILDPDLIKVGEVTHFFERINVCVVKITQGTILIGDKLTIAGPKNKLVQKVWSMQIESLDVKLAKKGQLIGLKVDKPVAVGDVVYK